VPNAQKAGAAAPGESEPLTFEAALSGLEKIVEAMESEELPLEELLAKYEQGRRLARECQEKLARAELKIQQLEQGAGGELRVKPLTPDVSE
jgi:exodeoxyribonuclease VII small subunit